MRSSQSLASRVATSGAAKLFMTGATVGPIVDSLHNQCLLEYKVAPIQVASGDSFIFCSSWLVFPLLGFAYVVLGDVVPKILTKALVKQGSEFSVSSPFNQSDSTFLLKERAIQAVLSTALIIKLSEYLETHFTNGMVAVVLLAFVAAMQWAALDGTVVALIAGLLAAFGGPLSELPFVAAGIWEYLPEASDYFPLKGLLENGESLGLSSITGPCYFAVTMDAIALGRWFNVCKWRDTETS